MTYHSHNYYGGPGAGKTELAVSAFWDIDAGKQIRAGRLLLFGREDNSALLDVLPASLVKRFVSPADAPMQFMEAFTTYMMAVIAGQRTGGLEVLVIDGLTEWNAVFIQEHTKAYGSADTWAGWRAAKDSFMSIIQMLNPAELKAHVLTTARVASKKRDVKSRSGDIVVEGDPDWVDSKYFPAMDGWMRDNLAYYFNLVAYMDADAGQVLGPDGKPHDGTVHKLYMQSSPQFLVKNIWEREWQRAGMPSYLTNPTFDVIVERIEEAKAKAAAVLAARTTQT